MVPLGEDGVLDHETSRSHQSVQTGGPAIAINCEVTCNESPNQLSRFRLRDSK